MEFIRIEGAKQTSGHYSPAVKMGNMICISGQLPIDPYTGEKCSGGIKEQTQQVLKNIDDILKAAKADKTNIMKMTIFVSDITFWGEINEIYAQYFGDHKPARIVVPVNTLNYGSLLEIEALAYTE
ncbi:MAG TPA: Rid family detoxifying hydrolase [Negativicutes bacterium]|nr:Rid family detoxifying hydrolase [Negativicutes bacterium]